MDGSIVHINITLHLLHEEDKRDTCRQGRRKYFFPLIFQNMHIGETSSVYYWQSSVEDVSKTMPFLGTQYVVSEIFYNSLSQGVACEQVLQSRAGSPRSLHSELFQPWSGPSSWSLFTGQAGRNNYNNCACKFLLSEDKNVFTTTLERKIVALLSSYQYM